MKSFPILDIAAFAVGALSVYGFAGGYSEWTETRGFELAEDCLVALDSDCAMQELDPYAGKWMGALRLVKEEGPLDQRVRKLIVDPEPDMRSDYDREVDEGVRRLDSSNWVPHASRMSADGLREFADLSEIMAEMGMDGTARRHRELVTQTIRGMDPRVGVLEEIEEDSNRKQLMSVPYGEFDSYECSNNETFDWRGGESDRPGTPFHLRDTSACYLSYFADRSDDELREFIEANLDAMRTHIQIVGNAEDDDLRGIDVGDRYLHPFSRSDYIDRIAFLATIIAWRESRAGWGF